MPIPRPTTKTIISTTGWGIPITDEVNRLTPLVDVIPGQLAALPKGRLASAIISADQTGIGSTAVYLTGFSVGFTLSSQRWVKLEFTACAVQSAATGHQNFQFDWLNGTGLVNVIQNDNTPVDTTRSLHNFHIVQLAAGSYTFRVKASVAPGSLAIYSNSRSNGRMLVTDLGA